MAGDSTEIFGRRIHHHPIYKQGFRKNTCHGHFFFLGMADMPIGYYTLLRIAVTIGAIAVIIQEFENIITPWIIIFAIIAILFNPIIPFYLHEKNTWVVIDLVLAILFGIKAFNNKS